MQPIPEDIFQRLPTLILEATRVTYNKKYFFIALKNGQNITVRAVNPAHMKQIVQSLQHQLEAYEKKHGEVKAQWSPNMLSPIQLKKPKKSEEK